jgi:hypothetical protein
MESALPNREPTSKLTLIAGICESHCTSAPPPRASYRTPSPAGRPVRWRKSAPPAPSRRCSYDGVDLSGASLLVSQHSVRARGRTREVLIGQGVEFLVDHDTLFDRTPAHRPLVDVAALPHREARGAAGGVPPARPRRTRGPRRRRRALAGGARRPGSRGRVRGGVVRQGAASQEPRGHAQELAQPAQGEGGGARPPSGIDAATVARARAAISDNVRPAKADGRVWSLTGGVAFCACGRRLVAKRTTSGGSAGRRKVYHYLICSTYSDSGGATCEHTRCHRA